MYRAESCELVSICLFGTLQITSVIFPFHKIFTKEDTFVCSSPTSRRPARDKRSRFSLVYVFYKKFLKNSSHPFFSFHTCILHTFPQLFF